MLCTTTTKPPSTSKFYVDFKNIFFKDQKNETHLSIFKCFAPCQVDLWAETLPFSAVLPLENTQTSSVAIFFLSCASSSFKGVAPKVLWDKVISRRSKELKSDPDSCPLVWAPCWKLGWRHHISSSGCGPDWSTQINIYCRLRCWYNALRKRELQWCYYSPSIFLAPLPLEL